jgi:mRNA interferase RelE/StbE
VEPGKYTINVLPSAARDLGQLPRPISRRVGRAIDSLADDPRPRGCEKLKVGTGNEYRIRVGDYRILYKVDDDEHLVLIVRVRHRREVYRGRGRR